MAVARTPRTDWIAAGLRALAAGGPDAVKVEPLAQALGVSKGGFYWYFDNRDALLAEMLDSWETEMVAEVIERVEAEGGDGRTRLRTLFGIADSGEGMTATITTDLAIRDWARRDPAVAERLRRVDNRRMDYLRSLYAEFCADDDEVEVRATMTFALWIGTQLFEVDHGPRGPEQVLALTTRWLLR
jgi:AcrR family transcriptional regulator